MASLNQSTNLRYMAVKVESTAGTFTAPAQAQHVIRVRNIEITPNIEVDDENAKFANGNHAEDESIAGAQSVTITGSVRCTYGGALTTVPDWWPIAYACGLGGIGWNAGSAVTLGSTEVHGISLVPREVNDEATYSVVVYDKEIGQSSPTITEVQCAGCVGTGVFTCEGIGQPLMFNFTLTGKLNDIVDGTDISMGTTQTAIKQVLLNTDFSVGGSSITNGVPGTTTGKTERISSFQLDLGNEVSPVIDQSDPTGYSHYVITARRPRFSCNPLAVKQATRDWLNELLSETASPLYLDFVQNFKIWVPDAQLISLAQANREGLQNWDLNFKLLQNGTPGSLTDSGLTNEDTFEFRQGTRA